MLSRILAAASLIRRLNVGNLSWRPQLPPSLFGNITGEIRESEAKKGKRGKERKQKQEKER